MTFNLPPLKVPFKGLTLNSKDQKKLKTLVKDEVKGIKDHFNGGAWNLNASLILSDIIYNLTGVDMLYAVMSEAVNKVPGLQGAYIDHEFMFTNSNDKIFYNELKHNIYVAKSAKDVDNDINLGDL